jgi:alpha-L-rhamnosidase
MVAPVGPPVRRCEEFPARGVVPAPGGAYIFDVGQNIQGWARLQVAAPAGTRLVLRYAEVLNPDGSLHTVNLRTARATDTYVCRGGGEEVWEPRYTVHGFRYVEIAGLPKPPAASAVTGIAVRSDVPEAGTFACSSDLVNRLHHCIVWTLRGNFLSVPTDCPQRDERLGWMGDGQVFAPTACFLADAASFYTKWVTDMRDAQSPAGAFSDVAPRVAHDTDGAPGWADAGVAVPWTVHRVYGDRRILERHYGAMARWVAYVREGNPDGIWRERAARNYGDWISIPADATPKEVMATAFFARSVGQFARIAEALGRAEDAARHRRLFEEVRAAFNRTFVNAEGWIHGDPPKDPQTGARRGDTQTVYALALRFGLLPEDRRPAAARRLVELIEANGGRLSTGFPGTAHLLPALTEAGHLDVAYRLLLQERWPSWGHMVRSGATTIWERWDGWTPERGYQDPGMNSFNHYALGAVGEWLFETVGGIGQDPDVPGWRRIVIRPRPGGGLTWAKATYESIRGRIESAWERKDGEFALRVVIPPGAAAAIHVPAPPGAVVTEGGRRAEEAPGVRLIRRGESEAVYEAGAGRYEFRVREGPG